MMNTMKCTVCGNEAFYKITAHNAKFCSTHFNEHILRQAERSIKEFEMFDSASRLLVAVSGGKDSMACWHILTELGYETEAVHLNMGFGEFSERSEAAVRSYATTFDNAVLHVYSFDSLMGFDFETARKAARKPYCSVCGSVKRYQLNRIAKERGCNVLVTGHNLDDEAAILLGNVLHWKMGYIRRQSPALPETVSFIRRVKPLVRIQDEHMRDYAILNNIPYESGECPNAEEANRTFYREIMGRVEEYSPAAKNHFYMGLIRDLQPSLRETERDFDNTQAKHRCPECGYTTLSEGLCFVCGLKQKVAENSRE